MKSLELGLSLLWVVSFIACDTSSRTPAANSPVTEGRADNTSVNARDRPASAKTPIDQNENQPDIDVTAEIRKRMFAAGMSINAQNVKIITQDGRVTLRGPVNSTDEKNQIERIAVEVGRIR